LKDMADYFGVTKQYIHKLKNEDENFPEPIMHRRVYAFTKEQVIEYGKTKDFKSKPHTNRVERMKRLEEEGNEGQTDTN
jgi:hypothetical protein